MVMAMWTSPTIEYPFSISSFTHPQCISLKKGYIGIFLVKMGMAQTTFQEIIFGPALNSTFNLPDLMVKQGTCHLQYSLTPLCCR